MWTNTIPVLSVVHITPAVLERLNDSAAYEGADGVSLERAVYDYGAFVRLINIPDELSQELPQCLQDVRAWAIELKHEDWVRFDADGDLVEQLPTY